MPRHFVRYAAALVLALAACSDDPTGLIAVDRVEVEPGDQALAVGDSVAVTAVALAADGDPVGADVEWRSLNTDVATVRAAGGAAMIVAQSEGTVRIEAVAGGRTGVINITVREAQVGSVQILPETLVLEAGAQLAVQAEVRSTTGAVLGGRTIAWSVEPAGTITVTAGANGWATVTALEAGTATVRAVVEGAAGQAFVQVVAAMPPPQQIASVVITPGAFSLPVGTETTLQAIAKAADGSIVNGRPVTWTTSSATIAALTPITGSPFAGIRAAGAGTVTIRAVIDGVAGETTVQVSAQQPPPQQAAYLFFNTGQRGIWVNQSLSLSESLRALNASGSPVALPAVTWSVLDGTIATVDANGAVRGLRPGTTKVRATSGTLVDELEITVFAPLGDVAVFDLTYDWWDDQWHMPPQIGTEQWTDENGVTFDVTLYALAGSLTVSSNGSYERVLRIEGWIHSAQGARKVVDREQVDRGQSGIIVGGETGYTMHSATTPGYVWQLVAAGNAGHAIMRAVIGTAPMHEYMFRLRQ
jgi:uncharacterized protein YjdB